MATDKQIAANRLNALKSTGPRTERGKRIAAANSRRDWNLADIVLITNESRKHFIGYLHSYIDHYKPQTPHERDLVETMAVARWRILRLWSFESCNMVKAVRDLPSNEEPDSACAEALSALQQNETGNRTQELLSRYEARYDRQYHRAARALEHAIRQRERIDVEHSERLKCEHSERLKCEHSERLQCEQRERLSKEKSQEHDEPNYPQQNQ